MNRAIESRRFHGQGYQRGVVFLEGLIIGQELLITSLYSVSISNL